VAESLSAEVPFCDRDCAEVLRIEQGVPSWGRELTEEIIPVEANLEESSIDYAKGCYIGQEVISRMKMSGQRNKSLCGLVAPNDTALISGTKLFSAADNEREIGWITSAVWSDRLGKYIGLGYLKRPFNQPGAEVIAKLAEGKLLPARVVNLPFAPG
jgi:folate-binding protein YgfZ